MTGDGLTFLGVNGHDTLEGIPSLHVWEGNEVAFAFLLVKFFHKLNVMIGRPTHTQRNLSLLVVFFSQQRFQCKLPPFAIPFVQYAGIDIEGTQTVIGANGIIIFHFKY